MRHWAKPCTADHFFFRCEQMDVVGPKKSCFRADGLLVPLKKTIAPCKEYALVTFKRQNQQNMTKVAADSEEEIVGLFRRGDASAMDRLYADHAAYLTAVCARYITDDDELKDVLQESMIKIFTRMGTFSYRGRGSLRAWMSRIVVNECLQTIRQRRRHPTTLLDQLPPDLPDEDPDIEGIDQETMTRLMARLPEGYRLVLNLYVIEGHSHKEIGEMLGIKPDSSASQLHRAKNMLAHLINEHQRRKI